jgi:hypothetical protein
MIRSEESDKLQITARLRMGLSNFHFTVAFSIEIWFLSFAWQSNKTHSSHFMVSTSHSIYCNSFAQMWLVFFPVPRPGIVSSPHPMNGMPFI